MSATATVVAAFLAVCPQVENASGNPHSIGDLARTGRPSVGHYQIRQEYLTDVKRKYRAEMIRRFGRVLTLADMKDPVKARWVATRYLTDYGRHYVRKTGRPLTVQVVGRIHNGGPDGWRRSATLPYWYKVARKLQHNPYPHQHVHDVRAATKNANRR